MRFFHFLFYHTDTKSGKILAQLAETQEQEKESIGNVLIYRLPSKIRAVVLNKLK